MSSDDSMQRIRTIRRKKDQKPSEEADSGALPSAEAASTAAPKPAAPQKAAPSPRTTIKRGPKVDAQALTDEADAMGADAMAKFMDSAVPKDPETGDQVSGKVVGITEHSIFLDIGAKSEAALDRGSLDDPDGLSMGDELTAYVVAADQRGIQLATKISGANARDMLAEAHRASIPVDGKVVARNPGGFTVSLGGVNAFCPVSQIARIADADLDSYVGKTMSFLIQEFKERDVVVSRRALEDIQAAEAAEKAWDEMKVGDEHEGVISGIQDFGVFVDIGGVQGLVHKTEFGWGESSAPEMGTRVKVKIKSIDADKQRISLTMKDPEQGPWSKVGTDFVEGGSYPGTVTRITDFGAFVKIADGLEGLIHVSEMADHRVDHPRTVVKKDQEVTVRIIEADRERGRIALSMKSGGGDGAQWKKHSAKKQEKQSLGTFADLLGNLKLD